MYGLSPSGNSLLVKEQFSLNKFKCLSSTLKFPLCQSDLTCKASSSVPVAITLKRPEVFL